MFQRLAAAIGNALGRGAGGQAGTRSSGIEPHELREIEFESLSPIAPTGEESAPLLCPVTRQELKRSASIYQCRDCRTCYSEAGWAFLRSVDRGRCCSCGQRKTVVRLS